MIAVTGGSGFLGRHILRALNERHIRFLALLRRSFFLKEIPRDQQRVVDFKRIDDLEKALQGVTQILHGAGLVNGSLEELREANVDLMHQLVEAARCAEVKRIIYLSSVAAPMRRGPYGQTKFEAEEILKSSGIPYLLFRPALIYGAGDTKNLALVEKMLKRFPVIPLLGGGRFLIQPVYVEDVVSVVIRALEGEEVNRIYQLAGPSQISLKEMVEILAESLGKKPLFVPVPLKPLQFLVRLWSSFFPRTRIPVKQILELDRHRAFEIEEARRDLGFSPRSFKEGVSAMRTSEPLCVG